MRKNILIAALLLAAAACHSRRDAGYLVRFNPPAGSTYHYELTNESTLSVKGGDKDVDMHTKSEIAVNYRIDRDSNEFLLGINYEKIHFHSTNGDFVTEGDATGAPGKSVPLSQILAAMKTDSIYARVRLTDFTVTVNGPSDVVDPIVGQYYAEADREQARTYWKQWVEQAIVWNTLDPLTWSFPDSARQIGDRWTISSTNKEDINFNIENSFHLESIHAGIATIRSEGRVSNDKRGTWLMDNKITGHLTGKGESVLLVDTATGMPISVQFSVNVGGNVEISGRPVRIKFGTTTKMEGKKVN